MGRLRRPLDDVEPPPHRRGPRGRGRVRHLTANRPMRRYAKKNFPVSKVRRFLEPGPVVLVSSAYKGERDIMTMGWHMMLGDSPSLVGCFIWDQNHSYELIRRSKQCVINVPTYDMADAVIGVG